MDQSSRLSAQHGRFLRGRVLGGRTATLAAERPACGLIARRLGGMGARRLMASLVAGMCRPAGVRAMPVRLAGPAAFAGALLRRVLSATAMRPPFHILLAPFRRSLDAMRLALRVRLAEVVRCDGQLHADDPLDGPQLGVFGGIDHGDGDTRRAVAARAADTVDIVLGGVG